MEIERKWLLTAFPTDLTLIKSDYIEQGYLSINPEVRIRSRYDSIKKETSYKLCIKGDGDLSRIEVETKIDETQFFDLQKMIHNEMITKDYKQYKLDNGLILECSIVDAGTENEFYYAEVEFKTEIEANAFILPFDAIDVTYDNSYKMKNYWKRTRLSNNLE